MSKQHQTSSAGFCERSGGMPAGKENAAFPEEKNRVSG
jgi:hypothetical protein